MSDELARMDAVGLAQLIAAGELSPVEAVQGAIDRIEAMNPQLNAVIHKTYDKALDAASGDLPDGPFRGVPFLLKDLWPASAGDPYHLGVQGLKAAGYTHPTDANITMAYRDAGFVIVGRTNTPELGLVATTEPLAYGPTHNPWNTDHGPGGSSGGAAAAVASGMVPAANASDGGGSIRIPAAMCGLVGLKPSRGRISMGPLQDEWGNSVQHVVSHSVRDTAAILDATAYPFPGDGVVAPTIGQPYLPLVGRDPGRLRIGVVDHSLRDDLEMHPEVAEAVRTAGDLLESLGHDVEHSYPDVLADDALARSFTALWGAGARSSIDKLGDWLGRPLTEDDVEPATWLMAQMADSVGAADVLTMQGAQMSFRRTAAQWWADGHDLLLTPTCMQPAPRLGELVATDDQPMRGLIGSIPYAAFTSPFNVTGQPGISLPLTRTVDGLPIGIQLVAAYGREDLLIGVAGQLETVVRWADNRAPMHP
ncbi:MAG: amidase [Acidimicrobiia bacterium]|nr:amidase [Acidimicrobiia bacterium]